MRQFLLSILFTRVSSYNLARWTPVQRSKMVVLDTSDNTPRFESYSDDYGDDLPLQKSAQCTSISNSADCNLLKGHSRMAEKTFPLTKAWLDSLDVGSEVDYLDFQGDWFVGTVVRVNEKKKLLKVRKKDWPSTFEEWVHRYSGRITKVSEKTSQLRSRVARRVSYSAESISWLPIHVEGLGAKERLAAKLYTEKARKQHLEKETESQEEKKLITKSRKKLKKLKTETQTVLVIYEDDDSRILSEDLPRVPEIPVRSAKKSDSSESHKKRRFLDIIDPEKKFKEYLKFLDDIRSGKVKEVDALDFQGYWWTSKVTILLVNNDEVNISFDQWIPPFDEFIPISSGKLAPLKSKAKGGRIAGGVKGEPLYPKRISDLKAKHRV